MLWKVTYLVELGQEGHAHHSQKIFILLLSLRGEYKLLQGIFLILSYLLLYFIDTPFYPIRSPKKKMGRGYGSDKLWTWGAVIGK